MFFVHPLYMTNANADLIYKYAFATVEEMSLMKYLSMSLVIYFTLVTFMLK